MYGDYHLLQLAIMEWLEKVVRRAVVQRVFGVLKVAASGKYYPLVRYAAAVVGYGYFEQVTMLLRYGKSYVPVGKP